ncbi:MAG: YebC/PmpR family DNA-binding transcriptional regulator [Proteobacteria bacterium]|nr:YebC/PmpR family DNA-binding transcriptional regulator [Pseudomonadota bacterium]
MAGHSKFKNIMYRKGAQDAKRAKVFGKIIREITVAARAGMPDPAMNAALRIAIQAAKAANMGKDTMARAIKRGAGGAEGDDFDEIRYEGFGPGGIAVIVETLSDNRNRTVSELRTIFNKCGGTLGDSGCVTFLFDRVGSILYPPEAATADAVFDAAIEAGAEDCESNEDGHEITCPADRLGEVRDSLEQSIGLCRSAGLEWKPQSVIELEAEDAEKLLALLEALEDCDDVRTVSANFDISDELMDRLSA